LLDAEAAINAAALKEQENEAQFSELSQNNIEICIISSKESSKLNSPEGSIHKDWPELTNNEVITNADTENHFITPIILINDKLPEDLDQKWNFLVQSLINSEKLKSFAGSRKYKRKFCRRKHAVFKRSYSIA
jgi:hypothetical protein